MQHCLILGGGLSGKAAERIGSGKTCVFVFCKTRLAQDIVQEKLPEKNPKKC